MLVIKSSADLLTYLKTRLKYASQQKLTSNTQQSQVKQMAGMWERGAIYAFEESIKAVEALINSEMNDSAIVNAYPELNNDTSVS